MAAYLYRNSRMEQGLLNKINQLANNRYGGSAPPEVRERIAAEMRHISGNGVLLAAAAALAEFSAAHGYPVGIRGLTGNLLVAHLLGLGAVSPLALGLRYEGCLGLDGGRMPEITLNVAGELLGGLQAHLREFLPDCGVLLSGPDSNRAVIVPRAAGAYDPANEYLHITLCPHGLISRAGKAWRRAGGVDISDEGLIVSAYRSDVDDIPVLGDLDGFRDLAGMLEPKSFPELVKVMGLALARKVWFQACRAAPLPDRFAILVGTREDVYDICVKHGIGGDDAFRIMGQASHGRLTRESRDMLAVRGLPDLFMETLDAVDYLYPRGQCADYMYWALLILARQPCRA